MVTLAQLPPELLDYILSLIPRNDLQSTTLSLTRVLPFNSISLHFLYKHLNLTREGQSWELSTQLRQATLSNYRNVIKTVKVKVWRDDSQLLINLLQSLPSLSSLALTVGPLFSPEQIEELLLGSKSKSTLVTLSFRFNPYVSERSYYTFLKGTVLPSSSSSIDKLTPPSLSKGTYFDIAPLTLSNFLPSICPNLKHLSFIQDLPPNHGSKIKVTPAFGLSTPLDLSELGSVLEEEETIEEVTTDLEKKKDFAFAQPIVFFKLTCLTTLSLSPIGSQLTHLVTRLPRRNLLPSLTSYPPSSIPPKPFPSLTHLDLSTTHLPSHSPLFPLFLRLYPALKHLVLDRVTGLIGKGEQKEYSASLTLIWLGKCLSGIPSSRSEEVMRCWRRLIRDRPTGVAAPGPETGTEGGAGGGEGEEPEGGKKEKKERKSNRSGFANMPRAQKVKPAASATKEVKNSLEELNLKFASSLPSLVKEILFIPPTPSILSLGLGLLDLEELQEGTESFWKESFEKGYKEGLKKVLEKGEMNLTRWELWERTGLLEQGSRRLVTFKSALVGLDLGFGSGLEAEEEETDEIFQRFSDTHSLISISPSIARLLLASIHSLLLSPHHSFSLCLIPNCSSKPGKPHLSLSTVSSESKEVRERREKRLWEEEGREKEGWWKQEGEGGHLEGCAHTVGREVWED